MIQRPDLHTFFEFRVLIVPDILVIPPSPPLPSVIVDMVR
jgi:hypothetical protein